MNNQHFSNYESQAANMMGMTLSLPMSRREAVRIGLFSTAGMMFANNTAFGAPPASPAVKALGAAPIKTKAKSVIQIFLWGGMSHSDTWDPKPDAGYDYNGPLKAPLATNVDGIQVSEWFPNLAKQADKYSLIRSMTHRNNGHKRCS